MFSFFYVCRISLVESIPENLTYPVGSPLHPSIYDAWMRLIGSATKSIDIAAFYWTLSSSDVNFDDPSDWQVLASSTRWPKNEATLIANLFNLIDLFEY